MTGPHPPGVTAIGWAIVKGPLLLAGVLAILAGLVAFAVPLAASVATATFIGIVLVCAAFPLAFEGFAGPYSLGGRVLRLLLALLTLAAGLYLLVAPLEGTYTLTVMLVIWFVAIGFGRIAGGLAALGTPGAGLAVANGAISLLLGILIAEELPESSDWAIGLLVGIDFLFFGISCLALAAALRRTPAPPAQP
jgi:uncharacterized membrane protein HdeD (DUF308 family)